MKITDKENYSSLIIEANQLKEQGDFLQARNKATKALQLAQFREDFNGACHLLQKLEKYITKSPFTIH